jgi:hypothetical protein
VAELERKLEQVRGEYTALRNERDAHLGAANRHRASATELRYQARRLRDNHKKESGEGRGIS